MQRVIRIKSTDTPLKGRYRHFQDTLFYKHQYEYPRYAFDATLNNGSYILTDFNYATLTSPYIFQKTVE